MKLMTFLCRLRTQQVQNKSSAVIVMRSARTMVTCTGNIRIPIWFIQVFYPHVMNWCPLKTGSNRWWRRLQHTTSKGLLESIWPKWIVSRKAQLVSKRVWCLQGADLEGIIIWNRRRAPLWRCVMPIAVGSRWLRPLDSLWSLWRKWVMLRKL